MKLLLPPGIGDVHWCMLKMQALAREMAGGDLPEVWLSSAKDGKDRAGDYVKKLPFVTFGGYFDMRQHRKEMHRVFGDGQVIREFRGFDVFYAYNRAVEDGTPHEEWWPGAECEADFNYPMRVSVEEEDTRRRNEADGPYILVSFYKHGWYREWSMARDPATVVRAIKEACPEHRIIITGAQWDLPVASALARETGASCMAGETSIDELFGMIRGASAFVGHAAGNAMMAVHLRTPTVMLWSPERFGRAMWSVWAPPDEGHYAPVDLVECTAAQIAGEVRARV